MPQDNQANQPKTLTIGAFSRGINSSVPINEIEDDEAVDILNMEFDDSGNLITRNGVVEDAGFYWDVDFWDVASWSDGAYLSRITSILDFENDSGFVGIIYTTGNQLFSRNLDGTVITNITGALALPNDVRWYWKILNGIAIGVNGLTSGDNPIKVIGPAPGTASKLTTAPVAKFIELWNSRLWIVKSDQPNQIQASNIGDPEIWDTDAGANPSHGSIFDIDKNDGDQITGIYATKERLFIFKKNSIWIAFQERQDLPVTDLRGLKIEVYAKNIGCLAATTIKAVLDDVLFLAEGGIASLSAAQVVADFESAIVSSKVKDISSIANDVADEEVFAFVIQDRSQYWLSVAANASAAGKNITYVLDYRQVKKGIVRWVTFDASAFGTSIEAYDHSVNKIVYLLGCNNTKVSPSIFFFGRYIPKASTKIFSDGSKAIKKRIDTKAFDFDLPNIRKYFDQWFLGITSNTSMLALSVSYFYNKSLSASGSYSLTLIADLGGDFYDVILYDTGKYDQGSQNFSNHIRRSFLLNKNGKKARLVQFSIFNDQANQGYTIETFGIKFDELSEFKSETI